MFQLSKEEANRQERLKIDAKKARQDMVARDKSATPPENPLHPDTASEFSERYGGSLYQAENNNPSLTGPANVRIEKRGYSSNKRKRKKIPSLQNNSEDIASEEQRSGLLQAIRKSVPGRQKVSGEEKKKGAVEKSLDVYGSTVGRGVIGTAYVWTNFVYLTFQVWLGIIAVIAIGLVFAIEYYVGTGVTRAVFDAIMDSIGVDWDFYLVATLCYMLVVATCYFQLFGVAIQAKSLGLHPLGGNGSFLKTSTFLCCFVLYWVPIINCLPLVNLYIITIQVYPR